MHDKNRQLSTIRNAAIRLLARREHSAQELVNKLVRYYDVELSVQVVNRLQADDFQSDQRFAFAWVRYRARKGFGPLRIGHELTNKGIHDELVHRALEQKEINWSAVAARAYSKKYLKHQNATTLDWPEKAKRLRFMQYRGFNQDYFKLD